jgi:hypothetical protein
MPRGKGIYDDENADNPTDTQDNGDDGDDTTTKQASTPDVAETDDEPTA